MRAAGKRTIAGTSEPVEDQIPVCLVATRFHLVGEVQVENSHPQEKTRTHKRKLAPTRENSHPQEKTCTPHGKTRTKSRSVEELVPCRDLSQEEYVSVWADGIHVNWIKEPPLDAALSTALPRASQMFAANRETSTWK